MTAAPPDINAMIKVEMYATPWCPYCDAARSLFGRKGVTCEEVDAMDPQVRADMIQRSHGHRTVPQIFIDGRHIGGYEEVAALERGGRLDPLLSGGEGPVGN